MVLNDHSNWTHSNVTDGQLNNAVIDKTQNERVSQHYHFCHMGAPLLVNCILDSCSFSLLWDTVTPIEYDPGSHSWRIGFMSLIAHQVRNTHIEEFTTLFLIFLQSYCCGNGFCFCCGGLRVNSRITTFRIVQ